MRKDLEVQLGELSRQLELQKVEEEEAAKKDLEDLKLVVQCACVNYGMSLVFCW